MMGSSTSSGRPVIRGAALGVLSLTLAFLGCQPSDPGGAAIQVGPVEFAGPSGSGEPNLHAASTGEVILTWHEPLEGDRFALRLAVRGSEGWGPARTVMESEDFFVNWADFPSLIELSDGSWLIHWLQKVAASPYAYHVMLARSADAGARWSEPFSPHRDDSATEHGFVSMIPWADGAALVWLDGRAMAAGGGHEGGDGGGHGDELELGEMQLRATTVTASAGPGPEQLLDGRTCECCQTSLVRTARGLVAAYRDRSEGEIRDIAVVRFEEGAWSEPTRVAEDGWEFPGCPVNGPRLASSGDSVFVVWFTGAGGAPAVYAAISADGARRFGERIRLDGGDPLGRVDAVPLADGSALAVWLERTADAAEIRARRIYPDGRLGEPVLVAETSDSRASGFPRAAVAGDEVLFAWTVTGDAGGVRVAAASLER